MSRLFRKILVPYDFSAPATDALRAAVELAGTAKGRLVVLHAIPPAYPMVGLPPVAPGEWLPPPVPDAEAVDEEQRRLERAVERVVGRRRTPRVQSRVVLGDPYQAIVEGARGMTAIVMGTLGRTGIPHLLLGSVAEKVVRHAPVPVLTIRPRALRRATAGRLRRKTAK